MENKIESKEVQVAKPDKLRRFMKLSGWVAAVLIFVIVMGATIADSKERLCNNVYIKIDHENGLFFLNEEDINASLFSFYNQDLKGALMRSVDFADIEEKLEAIPFIQRAEIYTGMQGAVHVDVRQRQPLVRIVNNLGVSYYLDVNGEKMPLSSKFTARVVVATGSIENSDTSDVLSSLLKLCRYVSEDEFWKAQFEQINVTESGEFELIPKLGNHIIRFGKMEEMESKLHKLMIFYKEVLKNFDAEDYRIINLKFNDQIVCTKNTF